MNPVIHAKPTTYRGVLFRSKSEAIFARALDLQGLTPWEYEPSFSQMSEWSPDFVFVVKDKTPTIQMVFLEYKPQEVTDSYREWLEGQMYETQLFFPRATFALAIVNPFDDEVDARFEYLKGRPGSFSWDVSRPAKGFLAKIPEAKAYRFDLKTD